jgi:hypothetical protein
VSRDVGAGCDNPALLTGPGGNAKKDFLRSFGERGHFIAATIAGLPKV